MPSSAPRTLADQLRSWDGDRLAVLLDARPDLAAPAPHDSSQLAARVVVKASVLRAMDALDALELAVLQALVQGADVSEVAASGAGIGRALARLQDLALVWGTPPRPVLVVGELLRQPDGPGVEEARELLEELAPQARAVLDTLLRAGVDGRWSGRAGPTADLVDAGLLVRRDERSVALPWTVRLAMEAESGVRLDEPPDLATSERDQALVDRAAAGAAFELVRRTELLLDRWGTEPPAALKAGGLGVRELRAAAALLHVETHVAALVVETAHAAGLLDQGMADDLDAAWLPTETYDVWLLGSVASRWTLLATAWRDNARLVSAVGGRDGAPRTRATKPVNALAPDLARSWLTGLRRDVLAELTHLGEGETLAPGTGAPSLLDRMRWRRPRRPASRLEQVPSVLAEAAQLGLTGLDGVSSFGRALVDGSTERASTLLDDLVPRPVDHVLLQADLTAIAPGPLEQELARKLALVADVESRGGATVYRFAAASVRRAFDAGWSSAEVHEFVGATSRTPVPQSLSYLIDDVSRRFGTLRAGHAEAFLRSDDETALTELVHAPGAESLRLRRIAPTVVVSDVPLGTLLPRLRELGLAPVVEAIDGTVRVARPDVFRARATRRRTPVGAEARSAARTAAVVAAIRTGDRVAASRPTRPVSVSTPADVIAVLRQAAESRGQLVIGYVGNDGTVAERVVTPERVEGGRLTAYDERSDAQRTFAIHRITAVTRASDS